MFERYIEGWEFDGRSDAYLRETYDLWAMTGPSDNWYEIYQAGMRAIVDECHARALVLDKALRGAFIDTPYRFNRRLMSFLASIDSGFAPIWQPNLRQHHMLGNDEGSRAYIETIELGDRVRNSFPPR